MSAKQLLMAAAGAQVAPVFIEDVFSTLTYEVSSGTQSLNAGVNLLDFGGFAWIKNRTRSSSHRIEDTLRGTSAALSTDTTAAAGMYAGVVNAFTNTGIVARANNGLDNIGDSMAVSLFRRQAGFCDVVTWTGNGAASRAISHSLGSVPGCIIVKNAFNGSTNWVVWHRSLAANNYVMLNATNGSAADANVFPAAPSATTFTVGANAATSVNTNINNENYVALVLAHNAGGFGVSGLDNVISCGVYNGTGAEIDVNLGYEVQWLLVKSISPTPADWELYDVQRGMSFSSPSRALVPNLAGAERGTSVLVCPTPTGFRLLSSAATTNTFEQSYIYVAIRRGPMRVPTSGASVYESAAYTGNAVTKRRIGSSVRPDVMLLSDRNSSSSGWSSFAHYVFSRMAGEARAVHTASPSAETSDWTDFIDLDVNAGWGTSTAAQAYLNNSGTPYLSRIIRCAPGFMSVVPWRGNGADRDVAHGLGVAPELIIHKNLDLGTNWPVYSAATGPSQLLYLNLQDAAAAAGAVWWRNMSPTSTSFPIGSGGNTINGSGFRYLSLLLASCPGVSKIGSYTGNGTSQTINCGFSSGARMVWIKGISLASDWLLFDADRGIVAAADEALFLNSPALPVTTLDYIDPDSSGFSVTNLAGVNSFGSTYLYVAIA